MSPRRDEVGVWRLCLFSSEQEARFMAASDRTPLALTSTGVKELWPTAWRTEVKLHKTIL